MGAAQLLDIHGAKGGSDKPKTPTEAPDSLRSIALAKMLIAVGEGEFDGIPTAKNIYLDNTPLQDEQSNFTSLYSLSIVSRPLSRTHNLQLTYLSFTLSY